MYQFKFRLRYYIFLASIVFVYILVILAEFPTEANHTSYCVFHNITGYPCGACGTGRGLIFLRYGYLYKALLINPLSIIVFIFSIVAFFWLLYDIINKKETFFQILNSKINMKFAIILFILVIANWVWNIEKGI